MNEQLEPTSHSTSSYQDAEHLDPGPPPEPPPERTTKPASFSALQRGLTGRRITPLIKNLKRLAKHHRRAMRTGRRIIMDSTTITTAEKSMINDYPFAQPGMAFPPNQTKASEMVNRGQRCKVKIDPGLETSCHDNRVSLIDRKLATALVQCGATTTTSKRPYLFLPATEVQKQQKAVNF